MNEIYMKRERQRKKKLARTSGIIEYGWVLCGYVLGEYVCVSVHLTVAIIIIDHEYSSNSSDLNVMYGLSRIICTFELLFFPSS